MATLSQTDTLPDGSILDLDSYDWENLKLTPKQKRFIVWYTIPNQEGFQNPTKAALKAGYTKRTSYEAKGSLLKKYPNVSILINKFSENFIKTNLFDATQKILQNKINRATYNIKDYYDEKDIENPETGEIRTITMKKPLTELTREQAEIIDNVQFTTSGIPTYSLPDREKEENDIIKITMEMNKTTNPDNFDVNSTVDIVKENLLTVKKTIKLSNQKARENAINYIENSENQPDFD